MTTEPTDTIHVWPDGLPSPLEGVGAEVAFPVPAGIAQGTTFVRNISDPTLTVFAPEEGSANGVGVVVVPGGGWTINAWTHEGVDVARLLAGVGYTVFVLKYRVQGSDPDQATFDAEAAAIDSIMAVPRSAAQLPSAISDLISTDEYVRARDAAAEDGRRAIAIVRERAADYGLRHDAVGMIGFSAGAFLAIDVALDPRAAPLAFIGAIYGGETRGAPVPADAPPLFTVVARDDVLYKIVERLHTDWSAADRPCELHVFARGADGFGMVRQGAPSDRWPDLFLTWLADLDAHGGDTP